MDPCFLSPCFLNCFLYTHNSAYVHSSVVQFVLPGFRAGIRARDKDEDLEGDTAYDGGTEMRLIFNSRILTSIR